MRYVTRSQWGARKPVSITRMARPVPTVYIHHSATPLMAPGAGTMRSIQQQHIDVQGWADIAYQECVDYHGDVYEARGFDVQGGATKGQNAVSLAICALGNYDNTAVPSAVIQSIVTRIVAAAQEGRLSVGFQIKGHKDAYATACPGRYLYERLPEIRNRVADTLAPHPPIPPEDDADMYFIYRLHKDALGANEAVDWIVPPNGPKFHCPSTHYTKALERAGAHVIDLTSNADASKVFRNAHP